MIATKIIATIGPATESKEQIEMLLRAGVNVIRFNLKHVTPEWHKEKAQLVRQVSQEQNLPVAILFDLQGAEIRTGETSPEGLSLHIGDQVHLNASILQQEKEIIIPNPELLSKMRKGDNVIFDDGKIIVHIINRTESGELLGEVKQGGILFSKKSVAIPSLDDLLPSITDEDKKYIGLAHECDVDFLALSYVRRVDDIKTLKAAIQEEGFDVAVIAKIETADAVQNIEEITRESDGIMIARGDLGVELPPEQVPYYQKHIINRCIAIGKPVITATQMLESMITNPYPTRAEVSDIANAMYDHTDAIMLSAETAIGKYPKESVEMMVATAKFIEQHIKPPRINFEMNNQTDALTHAAVEFVRQQYSDVPLYKAFILLTESGYASKMLSRHRPLLPIIALTRHEKVLRRLLLQRGVTPLFFPHEMKQEESSSVTQIDEMLKTVRGANLLEDKSPVVMVYGSEWGKPGRTNVLRIEQI